MPTRECVELGDELCVAPKRQLRLDALLKAGNVLLSQSRPLAPCERLLELCECVAAPELERPGEGRLGLMGAPVRERVAAPRVKLVEAKEVERVSVEVDDVARRTCAQQPVRKLLAELGDEDLHHLPRRFRHVVTPELVNKPVHRDDAICVKQQQR